LVIIVRTGAPEGAPEIRDSRRNCKCSWTCHDGWSEPWSNEI